MEFLLLFSFQIFGLDLRTAPILKLQSSYEQKNVQKKASLFGQKTKKGDISQQVSIKVTLLSFSPLLSLFFPFLLISQPYTEQSPDDEDVLMPGKQAFTYLKLQKKMSMAPLKGGLHGQKSVQKFPIIFFFLFCNKS